MTRCNGVNTNYTLIRSWRVSRYDVYDMWRISDCSFLTFYKVISWFSECNQMMLLSLRRIREMILRKNLDSNWKWIAHTSESRLESIIWLNHFRSWRLCIKSIVDSFVEWLTIEWEFDFFLNHYTSEPLNVIFRMFFSCFRFWFRLRNVRWICVCSMTHRFCQRDWKPSFLVNRWFFFASMRWTKMNSRSKNNLNCSLIESIVCQLICSCDSWKNRNLNR